MSDTKRLGREVQISAQSHAEILPRLEAVVAALTEANKTFLGKKLTPGHVLNGMILMLLDLSATSDDAALEQARKAVERLESWALGTDGPILGGVVTAQSKRGMRRKGDSGSRSTQGRKGGRKSG